MARRRAGEVSFSSSERSVSGGGVITRRMVQGVVFAIVRAGVEARRAVFSPARRAAKSGITRAEGAKGE